MKEGIALCRRISRRKNCVFKESHWTVLLISASLQSRNVHAKRWVKVEQRQLVARCAMG